MYNIRLANYQLMDVYVVNLLYIIIRSRQGSIGSKRTDATKPNRIYSYSLQQAIHVQKKFSGLIENNVSQ